METKHKWLVSIPLVLAGALGAFVEWRLPGDPVTARAVAPDTGMAPGAPERTAVRGNTPTEGAAANQSAGRVDWPSVQASSAVSELSPPSAALLRAQVAENPHATPRGLLEFSHRLADKMTVARTDESSAKTLFPELASCVMGDGGAVSVRAVCLENAQRLGRIWPQRLSSSSQDLEARAPKNVLSIARSLEQDD